jgi:hypothetical protein
MAVLMLAALLTSKAVVAQDGLEGRGAPLDLAVTYDALHANHITAQNFWMQGGAVELGARLHRGLGIAARAEGLHAGGTSPTSVPLSIVTTVFGPRYTVETHSHRYAFFGEGLVGIANGFDSLFSIGSGPVGSSISGTTPSSNSLALDLGGGVDIRLNRHFAVRALRASYLRLEFPNSTTNVQNSLSLGSGLAIRFGR